MIFDAVPNPVRVPLLYQWALLHLVPERRIGHFEILRPRRLREPIPACLVAAAHRQHSRLRPYSRGGDRDRHPCTSGAGCGTQIIVRFPAGVPHTPEIEVPITVAGLHFTVALQTSRASRYVVPLDRVWFWAAASHSRSVDTRNVAGAKITIVRRTIDPGRALLIGPSLPATEAATKTPKTSPQGS